MLLPDIAINRTLFEENNFQKNFKESFAKDLIDYGLPENVIFNGYEDLELLNITDSGTDKKFTVKVTYFELPAGVNANGTPSSSSRRRRLLANTIAGGATSGVSSSLSSAATASSGTNQTINVTASATEGSDSPTVDMDAAVLASIAGEISVISNQISASMAGLDDMITAVAASGGNPSAYKQRIADYWKSLLVAADETTKGLQSQAEETLRVLDATISVQQEALNSVLELEVLLKKQADELKAALDALGEDTNNELGKACQFRSNIGGAEIFFNVTKYSPLDACSRWAYHPGDSQRWNDQCASIFLHICLCRLVDRDQSLWPCHQNPAHNLGCLDDRWRPPHHSLWPAPVPKRVGSESYHLF